MALYSTCQGDRSYGHGHHKWVGLLRALSLGTLHSISLCLWESLKQRDLWIYIYTYTYTNAHTYIHKALYAACMCFHIEQNHYVQMGVYEYMPTSFSVTQGLILGLILYLLGSWGWHWTSDALPPPLLCWNHTTRLGLVNAWPPTFWASTLVSHIPRTLHPFFSAFAFPPFYLSIMRLLSTNSTNLNPDLSPPFSIYNFRLVFQGC